MDKFLVVGTGGLAREFTEFFKDQIDIVGYISDDIKEYQSCGLPGVFYSDPITPDIVGTNKCVIAIGSPSIRQKFSRKLKASGFQFPSIIHTTSVVSYEVLSEGVVVSPLCTIGPNVNIGKFVYLNFMVGIGHDCCISDYTQINPGAQVGGFSEIGKSVLVGSNATIRQNLKIAERSIISSGAVVLSNIHSSVTVIGNPARKLKFT